MNRTFLALGTLLLLVGCAGQSPRTQAPAPIEQRGDSAPTEATPSANRTDSAVISAYEPPPSADIGRPRPARAVEVLVARAEDQRRAGQLGEAAASLERALRIAPRDALLWHRLAQVRRDQQQFTAAIELANKSNSLARDDQALKRDNWQLIADARLAQGDRNGARAAQDRAANFR